MVYIGGGLILAAFFGIFFGSEGETDPQVFSAIFWGLIGAGVLVDVLVLVKEKICHRCSCRFYPRTIVQLRHDRIWVWNLFWHVSSRTASLHPKTETIRWK